MGVVPGDFTVRSIAGLCRPVPADRDRLPQRRQDRRLDDLFG